MTRPATRKSIFGAVAAALFLVGCDSTVGGGPAVFLAQNQLQVYPVSSANDFEVMARGGTGGTQYFCAAGDYAWRRLNAPAAARIVVTRPEGPSQNDPSRRAVGFTVVPQGTVPDSRGITANVRTVGMNYSVSHARLLCPSRAERGLF